MDLKTKIVALIGALALLTAPAAALAQGPNYQPEHTKHPEKQKGPKGQKPATANALGVICRGKSKQHVKGQKGTPFSNCVKEIEKVVSGKKTARAACKGFSKEHKAGEKGTPFSQCVVAAAKLKKEVTAG